MAERKEPGYPSSPDESQPNPLPGVQPGRRKERDGEREEQIGPGPTQGGDGWPNLDC